ncbi:unnamed protein product [Colletotrichum noveboracense]|uniref:Uncharacterized protein n=1 Tax=Colletotrichum noveboracense TaxID=2664923 RepID=A0A9W4RVY3_9PEZI|nr:unnamed protein product [Colletotrichum noveboracense]
MARAPAEQALHARPPPITDALIDAADEVREPPTNGLVSNQHPTFLCMKPCQLSWSPVGCTKFVLSCLSNSDGDEKESKHRGVRGIGVEGRRIPWLV